jgi:hypothetical protein
VSAPVVHRPQPLSSFLHTLNRRPWPPRLYLLWLLEQMREDVESKMKSVIARSDKLLEPEMKPSTSDYSSQAPDLPLQFEHEKRT